MHGDPARSSRRRHTIVLVVVGTILGIVFCYLAFRGVTWSDVVDGLRQMKYGYLLPSAALLLLGQFIRSVRFGLIVRPFCRPGMKNLWDLLNIWAAFNMILPARLAELVRPYLLRRFGASFSSGIGAILVERFFDLSGLLLLLGVVLWQTPGLRGTYTVVGQVSLGLLIVGYIGVFLVVGYRDFVQSLLKRILSRFPARFAEVTERIVFHLIESFTVMTDFRQVLLVLILSATLWVVFAAMTYCFLMAFAIEAPFLAAVTIQVFICLGVALPAAPGFIGTFHLAAREALTLFKVSAAVAVSFATIYHLFSLIVCLILGGVSYLTSDFRVNRAMFEGTQPAEDGESPGDGVPAGDPATRRDVSD
jgi:glycosyltransferase 2 family protein